MPVNYAPTPPITDPAWKITSSCTPTRSRTSEWLQSFFLCILSRLFLRRQVSPDQLSSVLIVIVRRSDCRCGYCGEEIFTRYAATYHIKYKHAGMARNFIQNKADVTQYYVNRAKREEEKSEAGYLHAVHDMRTVHAFSDQFKVIDTRRVKVPARHSKSVTNQQNKAENLIERALPAVPAPSPGTVVSSSSSPSQVPTPHSHVSTSSSNDAQPSAAPPDYRLLLAWSYYLASQAAWLSPMFQQQGQLPTSLPTDPQACTKFLQLAMQTAMDPLSSVNSLPNNEQGAAECQSRRDRRLLAVKEEPNGS